MLCLSLLQLLVLLLTLPHCLLMLPLSLRQGSWHKPGSNEPLAPRAGTTGGYSTTSR
jgi:hypothetical protein